MTTPSVILSAFADEAANRRTALEQMTALAAIGLRYYSPRFIDVTGEGRVEHVTELSDEKLQQLGRLHAEYGIRVTSIGSRIGKVKLLDVNDGSHNKFVPFPEYLATEVARTIRCAVALETRLIFNFKISCKASDPFLAVAAYMQLAEVCDYPLHVGVTEAGGLRSGTIKSAIGMGNLLWAGIGDTIRVSLSADPVEEVKAGFEILKSLGLRHRGVNVISCPSCARQQFNVIKTVEMLEERLAHISTPMTLSVIGCVVNGPGEALMTDIGFTGGGKGTHQVYIDGKTAHRLQEGDESIVDHLVKMIEDKAAEIEAQNKKVA